MANESTDIPALTFPDWVKPPLREFLAHKKDLDRVLDLSVRGIAMLRGRYHASKTLMEVASPDESYPDEWNKELSELAAERDLAQSEIDNGFPLLHAQATAFLWSQLEEFINKFCATWLEHYPGAWQAESIQKLKVKLGEYEALDPKDRCRWVVSLLDQDTGGPLRAGIARFEELLARFGLSGPLDAEWKKSLFELGHVRNVIVHRNGLADRRLLEACPWLPLSPGDAVKIDHARWHRYSSAVTFY